MKQLMKVFLGMGVLFSGVAMAQPPVNPQFTAADDSAETAVCLAIASNNSQQLHLTLRRYDFSRREVVLNVQCNGMPALQFARHYQLTMAQQYLQPGQLLARQDNERRPSRVN